MRKTMSILLTILIAVGLFSVTAFAAPPSKEVYVTISVEGSLKLINKKIEVNDVDSDGLFTINDALMCAHSQEYKGAGYATANTQWGLSITKLWGHNSSADFGYRKNNAYVTSLLEEVTDNDSVYAYVYKDHTSWSDTYSYFDKNTATLNKGESLEVTLIASSYDASWNLVDAPFEGATITLNGKKTDIKTDKNGKAVIPFSKAGEFVVSATSSNTVLVPPAVQVTVKGKNTPNKKQPVKQHKTYKSDNPKTGDNFNVGVLFIVSLLMGAVIIFTRKNVYEK